MHLSESDWAHVDERAQDFTGRGWVFERVRTFLASDARLLVIVAPPGSGKTAIAARLAQASDGRLKGESELPISPGTLAAAVFCRAGRVSLPDVAQDLGDQLSTALEGFAAEQRATVAPQVKVSDVHAGAAEVHPGGSVIGVKVDLARLGPERAFADGLALPLKRLAETPGFVPPALLVDSLDEAYASLVAQQLPGLLADLGGARLILTTRDDPRVLAAMGLQTAVAAGRAVSIHLIDDAPAGIDEVADYAAAQLRGRGPDEAIAVLARRIGEAAKGNFLYAYYVVNELLASSALDGLDVTTAADLPLPAGGLAGVYHNFLRRELGGDEERWSSEVRPILAPLAVALGDGLDTTQLAAIGSILAGRLLARSAAGDVTRLAGQFLQGSQPNGPFRVYHRSFAEFLLDAQQNPDWPIDAAEAHAAIVAALTQRDPAGNAAWSALDPYARTHLAAHAAACGRLDELLTDPGFLVVADVDRLLPLLWDASSAEAREAAAVVQLASANLRGRPSDERASYLELAARMRGADTIADRIATLFPDRPWSVPAASWHPPAVHVPLLGHQGGVSSVAMGNVDGLPIAVSSGVDGTVRVWDLRTLAPLGEPMRGHKDAARAVVVGELDGQPVVVSGGWDGTVRVWDLRTMTPLSQPLHGHEGVVRGVAVGAVGERRVVISGGDDGSVRVWNLRTRVAPGVMLYDGVGPVYSVAVGAVDDRPVAVSGGKDGIRRWDLGTLTPMGEPLRGDPGLVFSVAVAMVGNGPVAVSGGEDGTVRVWDLRTFSPLGDPLQGHEGVVRGVAVGAIEDQSVAVSGGWDGTVRVWDLRTLSPLGDPLRGHDGPVLSVAVGEVDGRPVAVSGGNDGTVRVWDLRTLVPLGEPLRGSVGDVRAVAVGDVDAGPVAVSGSLDGTVWVWDLRTPAPAGLPLYGHDGWVSSLAVDEVDERRVVVSGGEDGAP